ncbi:hypothetical protein NDU88_008181 [Pleurodeles waltl]|uniref:Uncharacterized protein n=1 Tax=Pleurodeles waltl TaxID=8319 RepID=A0AAV7QU12_PLEWA|nr:hypothetical protein NDU88_008181 [Pleurodeles waltl]
MARRAYGVCGDRREGNGEPLPSPCFDYPLRPTRGDEGRETNPVVGHWGCLPISLLMAWSARPGNRLWTCSWISKPPQTWFAQGRSGSS